MKWANAVLGLIALSGLASTVQASEPVLSICYEDTANPPFYFGTRNANKDLPGVTIELIKMAAAQQGRTLKLSPMPWKRCLAAMQNNTVDGAFDFSYKAKRESFAVYPYSDGELDKKRYLHELAYYLFTLQDSDLSWDGKQLSNPKAKLAAVSGYSIVGDLREDGYEVHEGLNQRSNLEMLIRKRADGLAQFATTTQALIDSRPQRYAKVVRHAIPLRSKLYYLVFSKRFMAQQPAVAEKIWDAIALFNSNGTTERITAKYAK